MKSNSDDKKKFKKITSGKILGIDYGTKNIGLAISDAGCTQAFIYETLQLSPVAFTEIKNICREELIDKIVVGLPLSLSGGYSKKTEEVICFVSALESVTGLIVETEDERFSTKEAKRQNTGYGIDEASAQIILQKYLDRNNQ